MDYFEKLQNLYDCIEIVVLEFEDKTIKMQAIEKSIKELKKAYNDICDDEGEMI